MAEIEIREAPDAEAIAKELIPEYHPHLQRAQIIYLLTTQERKSKGRVVLGTAQKLGSLLKYFSSGTAADLEEGYDFCILISAEEWALSTPAQRRALVDHELNHCAERVNINRLTQEITRNWYIRGHDVEEFRGVIERHGLWRPDLRQFAETAIQHRQPTLFDAVESAEPESEAAEVVGSFSNAAGEVTNVMLERGPESEPAELPGTEDVSARPADDFMRESGWPIDAPPTNGTHPHTESDAEAEREFATACRRRGAE